MFRCTVQIILMFCLLSGVTMFWLTADYRCVVCLANSRLWWMPKPLPPMMLPNNNFSVHNAGSSTCYYFVTINEGRSGNIRYDRQAKITYPISNVFRQANRDFISYQLYSKSITTQYRKTLDHAVFDRHVLGPFLIRAGQILTESFRYMFPRKNAD